MTRMPDGRYSVDSFREEGVSYVVDVEGQSCSCPQYVKTGRECKHLIWVRMELKTLEEAKKQPEALTTGHAQGPPLTEAELRAIFA